MRAHLGKAAVELAFLADEHGVDGGLHVVVDAALAGPTPEGEGPRMGVEHHLLGLARISPNVGHAAVAKPDLRYLGLEGDAVEDDPFFRPIELISFSRREGQRDESLGGFGRRRRLRLRPALRIAANRVIAAGIPRTPQRLE